jgi:hypothetical protein
MDPRRPNRLLIGPPNLFINRAQRSAAEAKFCGGSEILMKIPPRAVRFERNRAQRNMSKLNKVCVACCALRTLVRERLLEIGQQIPPVFDSHRHAHQAVSYVRVGQARMCSGLGMAHQGFHST